MRSRDDSIDAAAAVERALRIGLCGMGGRIPENPDTIEEALVAVDRIHGERASRRLERFAHVPAGAFVWTKDVHGMMWLGRLTGPWRYDPALEAVRVDLVHVRPTRWSDLPIPPAEVPAAVHETFARGGRNWQRIRRPAVEDESERIWGLGEVQGAHANPAPSQ